MAEVVVPGPGLKFESLRIEGQGVYAGFIDQALQRQCFGITFSGKDKTLEGQWLDDRFEGIGAITHKDGRIYLGQLKDGKKHGIGRFINNERQILGQFENGSTHGVAIMQIPEQRKKISGYYAEGQLNGFGIVKSHQGDRDYSLRAFFEQGIANNIGTEKAQDKLYEGQFQNNTKTGVGQFADPNYPGGSMRFLGYFDKNSFGTFGIQELGGEFLYEGAFQKGVKSGVGRLTSPVHQSVYVGELEQDMQEGFGKYQDSQGTYIGSWHRNSREGMGALYETKRSYVGHWKEDMRHGVGVEVSPNFQYRGEWLQDMPHGRGLIETPDGVVRCVSFSQGVLVNEVEGANPADFMRGITMIDVQNFKQMSSDKLKGFETHINQEVSLVKKRFESLGLDKLKRAEAQFHMDIKNIKEKFVIIVETMEKNRAYFKTLIEKYGFDLDKLASLNTDVQLIRKTNTFDPFYGESTNTQTNHVKVTLTQNTDLEDRVSYHGRNIGQMMNHLNLSPEISPEKKRGNQDFIIDNVMEIKRQIGKVLNKAPTELPDYSPTGIAINLIEPTITKTTTYRVVEDERPSWGAHAGYQDDPFLNMPLPGKTFMTTTTTKPPPGLKLDQPDFGQPGGHQITVGYTRDAGFDSRGVADRLFSQAPIVNKTTTTTRWVGQSFGENSPSKNLAVTLPEDDFDYFPAPTGKGEVQGRPNWEAYKF